MIKFSTTRFGEVEIEKSKIIHFEDGLPAFDEEHDFLIVPYEENSPYSFLQSVHTPDLAFLMTSPFVFFPTYEFGLNDDQVEKLGLEKEEDILLYVLITIPGKNIKEMTANLLAPVVINQKNLQAEQVVLTGTQYTTKHRLFPDQAGKGGK